MRPSFSEEKRLWKKGFTLVAGIDEVGRGSFAGPVVAGAVVFPKLTKKKAYQIEQLGINDSKVLRSRQRERLTQEIKKQALAWDVTEIGVATINKVGIGKATQKGMRKTVLDLERKLEKASLDFVLIDAFYVNYLKGLPVGRKAKSGARNGRQKAIVSGDAKSISIAAASILAKVYRDRLMRRLGRKYPAYGWGKNKGYGTKLHQKAIKRYGLTRYHRKQFVKTWQERKTTNLFKRS